MNIDPSVLRRIKKCLALANDGRGNEAEAAAALRQAQALMRQHNVDQRTLARAELAEATGDTGAWTRPAPWEYSLGHLVARAFGCGLMALSGNADLRRVAKVVFIGPAHSVELAAYAYTVCRRSAWKTRSKFLEAVPGGRGDKIKAGESFCQGYVSNLNKQVASLTSDPGTAQAIQELIAERCGTNKAKVSRRSIDNSAYFAGREAGANLSLNRPMSGAEQHLAIGHN